LPGEQVPRAHPDRDLLMTSAAECGIWAVQLKKSMFQGRSHMRQKYLILKDPENGRLILREFAEVDKEMLSLLCEETYASDALQAAIAEGPDALARMIRTHNMYPPGYYTQQICEAIITLLQSDDQPSAELQFDDKAILRKAAEEEALLEEEEEDEGVEIDNLLDEDEDESADEFEEEEDLSTLSTSLKVAEDDSLDVEDES